MTGDGQVDQARAGTPARRSRGRTVVAAVLVALGALLAPVALTAVWLHQEVSDTERFVATMSPLISQPSVQATLTDRVTDAIVDHLDVGDAANQTADALAAQGLPRRASEALRGLAAPLESGLRDFVHTRVGDLLSGDQAAEAWQKAISAAHTAATAVLSGTAPAVSVQGDDVVVDLAPLVDAAKQRLVADGLILADRVPEVHPTIRVADATDLERARTAYSLLDRLATWLPVAALVLLVGGVAVARRRRRTLLAAGLGVAAGMVLLAVALAVARAVLVGKAQPDDADATAAAFDVVVRLLRDGLRVVLVLGLAVALVAFLSGPSTPATGIRRAATGAVRALRAKGADAGWRTGRVGTWVHTYRGVLRGAAFAIAALVFVFLDQPGVTAVVVLGAALVLCLVVIRLFDRAPVG